jgi:SPP1 family predicted phage head-tail adaptor
MKIGRMDQRIEIQDNQSSTQDAHGNPVADWRTVLRCWAAVSPASGGEAMVANQVNGKLPIKITMRPIYAVTTRNRVRVGTRLLDVNSVVDVDSAGRVLELVCTEAV